jgi:hypothetical protein
MAKVTMKTENMLNIVEELTDSRANLIAAIRDAERALAIINLVLKEEGVE